LAVPVEVVGPLGAEAPVVPGERLHEGDGEELLEELVHWMAQARRTVVGMRFARWDDGSMLEAASWRLASERTSA
jgi:hypothetical protein